MTITGGPDIVQVLLSDKPSFHLGGEAAGMPCPRRSKRSAAPQALVTRPLR